MGRSARMISPLMKLLTMFCRPKPMPMPKPPIMTASELESR